MGAKIDLDIDDFVKDIMKSYYNTSDKRSTVPASDLSDLGLSQDEFEEVMRAVELSSTDIDSEANQAVGDLVGALYMLYRRSEGKNFAMGEISREALDSIDLFDHIDYGLPEVGEDGYVHVKVYIYNDGSLYRQSVRPEKYGGIDNILEMLNSGYKDGGLRPTRRSITGYWHGKNIHTLRQRLGAHFFDDLIPEVEEDLYAKYNLVDIYWT